MKQKEIIDFDINKNPSVNHFDKLHPKDKQILNKFELECNVNAGDKRAAKYKRNILKFIIFIDKPIEKITIDDLTNFLITLKKKDLADYTKNDLKHSVKRFLQWKFKDWSERFDELKSIKLNKKAKRKKPITSEDVIGKEEFERLMRGEPSLYWKTFLIVQKEGALRTSETRTLKWEILEGDDGEFICFDQISKKNKEGTDEDRPIILKEARYFLNELQKEQENSKKIGTYIFKSPYDKNKPISESAVSKWMEKLSLRILGKKVNNYLLRHSRGTEYKKLVKEGKMSKDNATETMGHSEKMFDKVYSHMDKEDIKEILKKQIFNLDHVDISKQKRHRLETEIEELKKQLSEYKSQTKENEKLIEVKMDKKFEEMEQKMYSTGWRQYGGRKKNP